MASTPEAASGPSGAARTGFTAVVNDHGAERLRAGHPWTYDSDILGWEPEPPPDAHAAPVRLRDRRGRDLGIADFSPHSRIRLRRLDPDPTTVADRGFFAGRIAAALAWREQVVRGSDAYRLISAEADGLPGLIVDRYADALVVQTLTWAMAARQPRLLEWLDAAVHPARIVLRNEARVRRQEGLELESRLLRGDSAAAEVRINGIRFTLDLLAGQKTGGFLDQRENWAAAAAYASHLGARDALDVFTYQGGFALHLARVCARVEGVDSSRAALEAAERNAQANGLAALEWTEANAFDLLRGYSDTGRRFDCVVLDPPAFAKSRAALRTAIAGYKEINLRALKLLRPGGLLVTCSCSHHLSESHLLELLAAAAADAHRVVLVLERRTQAPDHPVLLAMPESQYLKCVIARAR